MSKKWLVGIAGLLLSVTLVACGGKSVATTNGGKITQDEYYSSMKETSQGKQTLQQMILNKVLEKQFGDKVKSSEVNAQMNTYKSQYGSQFQTVLQSQGMTEKSLKEQLRSNLLLKQAVIANTDFSDKELKKQFKEYQPKVTVNQITTSSKKDANKVISELDNGKKFSDLAKKYSTDSSTKNKGGRIDKFDNTNSSLDSNFKKAAFNLKNGEYTKSPVKTQSGYQVIQMVNHPDKGNYKQHASELKEQIADSKMNDSSSLQKVVKTVLKKGDVDIQDNDLKNVLADYLK